MLHDRRERPQHRQWAASRLWQSLAILAFGVAIVVFLVAIDRPHWSVLKPATGTATAIFVAGNGDQSFRTGNDATDRR